VADKKITELTAATNHASSDLLLIVKDAAGTPTSRKATFASIFANVASPMNVTNLTTLKSNTTISSSRLTINANTTLGSAVVTLNGKLQTETSATIIGNNGKLHANNTITGGTVTVPMLQVTPLANTAGRLLINDRVQVANAEARYSLKSSGSHTGTTSIDVVQIADAKGLRLPTKSADPASSNANGLSISAGTIFYSNTYLYITTDTNTIKRIALQNF
jgi:hypothetical protein